MNAFTLSELDNGYQTVPQEGLGGRQLQYLRGKGLGGSAMINFMTYTREPSVDWNHWAEMVEDPDWN
jgi:choline dehydrogenase